MAEKKREKSFGVLLLSMGCAELALAAPSCDPQVPQGAPTKPHHTGPSSHCCGANNTGREEKLYKPKGFKEHLDNANMTDMEPPALLASCSAAFAFTFE